jgi:hypothetical protein
MGNNDFAGHCANKLLFLGRTWQTDLTNNDFMRGTVSRRHDLMD